MTRQKKLYSLLPFLQVSRAQKRWIQLYTKEQVLHKVVSLLIFEVEYSNNLTDQNGTVQLQRTGSQEVF